MKRVGLWLLAGGLIFLSGCGQKSPMDERASAADIVMPAKPASLTAKRDGRPGSKYLAYSHQVTIELPANEVANTYHRLLEWCAADKQFRCIMLQSHLSTDRYIEGRLEVRIQPDGVDAFLQLAEEGGSVTRRGTQVEDLGEAVVDNQKRLEMLRDYRARLEALQQKPEVEVEALVKIAEQLAEVQSNLEFAEGRRAKLLQRVETDRVSVALTSYAQRSFFQPIGASLKNFSSQLSEGISDAITAFAYLLPWLLLLVLVVFGVRKIWIRAKRR